MTKHFHQGNQDSDECTCREEEYKRIQRELDEEKAVKKNNRDKVIGWERKMLAEYCFNCQISDCEMEQNFKKCSYAKVNLVKLKQEIKKAVNEMNDNYQYLVKIYTRGLEILKSRGIE